MIQVEETTVNQLTSQQNAVIHLPASVFAQITDQTDLGLVVGYYETATLFPITSPRDAPRQTQVYSNVIAATVGQNTNIQNLKETVTIAFRLQDNVDVVSYSLLINNINSTLFYEFDYQFIASGSEKCVSWDFNLQTWTSRGCMTDAGRNDGTVLCHCNHLTNFAVLVVSQIPNAIGGRKLGNVLGMIR